MQCLNDLAVAQHLQHLFGLHDIHMNIFRRLLVLLAHFLHAGSQEGIR